jgi:hypothetical protein
MTIALPNDCPRRALATACPRPSTPLGARLGAVHPHRPRHGPVARPCTDLREYLGSAPTTPP